MFVGGWSGRAVTEGRVGVADLAGSVTPETVPGSFFFKLI